MTTDRDDDPVRRYREANAALDERPSAGTRAAILAAAARQVEARPQVADAPGPVRRRRWPLAAAAVVLLSTLAAMLATRTEQEMPTFTAPVERAPEKTLTAPSASVPAATPAAPPAPPARVPEHAPTAGVRADGQAADRAPTPRSRKSAPAAAPDERALAAPAAPEPGDDGPRAMAADSAKAGAPAARESAAASAEARSASPTAPPPAVAGPAPAQSPASAFGAAGSASDSAKPEASTANRLARKELAPAPAVQGAVREDSAREFERSARDWIERIVKLRGEARHAEADAELKRFRERYPDIQVPLNALPPAGTAPGTR